MQCMVIIQLEQEEISPKEYAVIDLYAVFVTLEVMGRLSSDFLSLERREGKEGGTSAILTRSMRRRAKGKRDHMAKVLSRRHLC